MRINLLLIMSFLVSLSFIPRAYSAEPFGTDLGNFNGVTAYSNCSSYCVSCNNYCNDLNYIDGTYIGIKWQCVEYVRRYYYEIFDLDLASKHMGDANTFYDYASDMDLDRYANGGPTSPQVGDILVSEGTSDNVGHVAIVRSVSDNQVCTMQQNFSNDSRDINRCLTLTLSNGNYTVSGFGASYPIVGWLRNPEQTDTTTTTNEGPVIITGNLQTADGRSIQYNDHHYTDLYTFTLSTTTQTQISMTSTFNDDRIFLYRGSVPTNDSYIQAVYTGDLLNEELNPGTYCIEVTSGNDATAGNYTITSSVGLTQIYYQYLNISDRSLEISDGRAIQYNDHHYTDLYTFTLSSVTRVQLWMTSTFNDDRIFLYRGSVPTNDSYVQAVYTGDLLNEELNPGTYCIEVTSGNDATRGNYTITSSVNLTETVEPYQYLMYEGVIEPSDGQSIQYNDRHYTDLATFTLSSVTRVQLWMTSTFNDDRVFLYRGSVPTNDSYVQAVYTGDLLNEELNPGTYCIEITSGNDAIAGNYTITSSVEISGATPITTTTTTPVTTTTSGPTTTITTTTITTTTTSICPSVRIYDEGSEEVQLLRYFRDGVLSNTPEGRELIKLYYLWSPFVVQSMENDEEFKKWVKEMIDSFLPMIDKEMD